MSWDTVIDPCFFTTDARISNSSTPANALTLLELRSLPPLLKDNAEKKDQQITESQSDNGEGEPKRLCTVKGCKAMIGVSYEFKMCPPCRTRYRIYGRTKRAKWKMEREAFELEMSALRVLEDEGRKKEGLDPLSKNPEALRACELSIIDEQVQTPIVTVQMEENGEILKSDNSSQTNSPTIATAVYPATERPMATLQPASPYPQLNNGIMNVDPSPARMCTVSHCHKILPGHHRFKRCEQHRLQNRHHSKLKRVRSKEGVNANNNQCQSDGTGNLDESKLAGNDDETANTRNSKKARKEKGNAQKSLVANEAANQSEPLTVVQENGSSAVAATRTQDTSQLNDADVSERFQSRVDQHCTTCEECRNSERSRQMGVRTESTTEEHIYWKEVAGKLSAGRVIGETVISSQSHVNDILPQEGNNLPGPMHMDDPGLTFDPDLDADADAEGDLESENEDEKGKKKDQDTQSQGTTDFVKWINFNAARPMLITAAKKSSSSDPQFAKNPTFNSMVRQNREMTRAVPDQQGAFSKFRVEIASEEPVPAIVSQLVGQPSFFKGFQPQSTSSAVGRILASNPQVSVDAFADILKVQPSSQMIIPPTSNTAQTSSVTPTLAIIPIPTPTIPTSAPFVYKPPNKKTTRARSSSAQSRTQPAKGKRKAASSSSKSNEPASVSAQFGSATERHPTLPSTSTPSGPCGYPSSYPYYPYYMPPYPMVPYPGPELPPVAGSSKKTRGKLSAKARTTPSTPNFFPYPYPPLPYGYLPPHNEYPFKTPLYTDPSNHNNTPVSTQPFPGPLPLVPPVPFAGYPFYMHPSSSISTPISATPVSATFTPTINYQITAPKSKADPKLDKPSVPKGTIFNHYQHPHRKKRGKKKDPQLESAPVTPTLAPELSVDAPHDLLPTPRTGSGPNQAVVDDPISSIPSAPRSCIMKTCRRIVPASTTGPICEKCKARFKKHKTRAKHKFKLEPRKVIVAKTL